MQPSSQLSIHHGIIEDLTRTTQITRGGETRAQTTHIAMLKIAGKHCQYRSDSPFPISEGEIAKVAGVDERGLFQVYAIRNESTGYVTEELKSGALGAGCLIVFMVFWCCICLGMTVALALLFLPLAVIPLAMAGFGVWAMSSNIRTANRNRALSCRAHTMLRSSTDQTPFPSSGPPSLPPR